MSRSREFRTHVLLDSWYCAKVLWKAARERGFLITTGRKCNRWLRIADPTVEGGWRWQRLSDYTAQLQESSYQRVKWPGSAHEVYVHVVTTRVRKLYQCQVVIVRQSLDAPLSQTRSWASSDLEAELPTLLTHIATRWKIEVLFGDGKEKLGLDHYQLMSAVAIVRFWTLALLAYVFLEEERARLQQHWQRPVTIGEARLGSAYSIGFMTSSNPGSNLTPCMIVLPLEAAQPKSAKIECKVDFVLFSWENGSWLLVTSFFKLQC